MKKTISKNLSEEYINTIFSKFLDINVVLLNRGMVINTNAGIAPWSGLLKLSDSILLQGHSVDHRL